jgi:SAM-dependent methyltransferase
MIKPIGRAARRGVRMLVSRLSGNRRCPACGFRGRPVPGKVLWPELIAQWELSPEWAVWIDQREGLTCARCGSNLRSGQLAEAILAAVETLTGAKADTLDALFEDPRVKALQIAEINSAGALHPFLSKCPNLRYSEFGARTAGVASEDLTRLSYGDSMFDLVITSETLEHVPDVDAALGEIRRVLKPGGFHVFTTPVIWDRPKTRQRARLEGGELVHLLAPSYHGDWRDPKSDHLVFYEFGADFVERCGRIGYDVGVLKDQTNPALCAFIARKLDGAKP